VFETKVVEGTEDSDAREDKRLEAVVVVAAAVGIAIRNLD